MTGAASPFLRLARWGLAGLATATWLTGLALVLDRISTASGAFRGFDADMIREVAATLGLFGLGGAVLIVAARRILAEGGARLAYALVGVCGVVAGFSGLGFAGLMASVALAGPGEALDTQLIAAAALPLLATFGALGCAGTWASVAAAPPAWPRIRFALVRVLCAATGCAAGLVAIATARATGGAAPYVGAPVLLALVALAAALGLRARKNAGAGELLGALVGYALGAVGALLVAGYFDAATTTGGDPRAQFVSIVLLWPVALIGAVISAAAVATVAGSLRETFGRVRRALA